MSPRSWRPATGLASFLHHLAMSLLAAAFIGCQVHPFGPRFVVDPPQDQEPLPADVTLCDARPAWQRRYWQGAVAPRDYELAITVIPLEKFAFLHNDPRGPLWRTPDQQGWESTREELRRAVFSGLRRLGLADAPTVITLDSAVVVVNKSRSLQTVWEQTADARREALSHWRRGGDLRLTLGVSSGLGTPLGPGLPGPGVHWGSPPEIPPLPGEQPLSRAYGPVRGPPPDLGDYGPDVTCDIQARVEVQTPARVGREVQLRILTHSLPLEPPNFLSDEAVISTFRAALDELTTQFVEAWQVGTTSADQGEPAAGDTPDQAQADRRNDSAGGHHGGALPGDQ